MIGRSASIPPILDYAPPLIVRPRRWWLPVVLLLAGYGVWDWPPHLTPTQFPNLFDCIMLGSLAVGAFIMGRYSSLPRWVFIVFGATGVSLFLFVNFNDNNFRRTVGNEIILPWCGMVMAGAGCAWLIAFFSRRNR